MPDDTRQVDTLRPVLPVQIKRKRRRKKLTAEELEQCQQAAEQWYRNAVARALRILDEHYKECYGD